MFANTSRSDWVDVAKGICIIMVVMMHSTLGVEKEVGATGWLGYVVEFAKPFRMPDFFLISGLFLERIINRDWRTFFDRRVIHFLYFYILWLTIQFALKAPGMIAEAGVAATFQQYLLSIFVEPFGTLWFIWLLPFFALTVRLTRFLPAYVIALAAIILEIAPIATGWTAVDEFCSRFIYFYLGYLLAPIIFALAADVKLAPRAGVIALMVWAPLNGLAAFSGWAFVPGLSLLFGLMGALAIVTLASLANMVPRLGSVLRFYGENSIVVYLSFFLPMATIRFLLLYTGIITDIGTISLVVTVFAATVPFIMRRVANGIGLRGLYERPQWARLQPTGSSTKSVTTGSANRPGRLAAQ